MLIGEILQTGFGVKKEEIDRALTLQLEIGGYVGQVLINMGAINETVLIAALSQQLSFPVFDPADSGPIDEAMVVELARRIDVDWVVSKNFVPVAMENGVVTFITNDPLDNSVMDYMAWKLGGDVCLMLAAEQVLKNVYRPVSEARRGLVTFLTVHDSPEALREMAAEAPVIKFLNNLLSNAVEMRASDIHMEPADAGNHIRMRIDGVMHDVETLPEKQYLAVVSRVKLLAGLDIAEKRLPQDGKFSPRVASALIDLRVSCIPFASGEGVVMRLLYREKLSFDLGTLGLLRDMAPVLDELIHMPYGIMLVTGPTGSGKTTTLYSILKNLDHKVKKIITVEDPVEYRLEGVNQIQVKSEIGLDFAASLRSILRHDPDVIMVGEIRDPETARVAVQSALTGHLVLSTLHTNDAPGSLFRLIEMGVEDYLLNASIVGIAAQRIVRRVCDACAEAAPPPAHVVEKYGLDELYERWGRSLGVEKAYRKGKGCKKCAQTGYKGMIAVFEMFKYTDDLREIFITKQSVETFRNKLVTQHGFRTIREDGLLKVISGATTMEEVLRVS
jgi:type II secretory ATPase GspE/PulE/Tfp pilus assembly ATPase PilB-like protein